MFNQDQSHIHQYSSGMSSTISMNKQNNYSHIASIWKGTQIEASIESSAIPTTSTETFNNSNNIANTLQEDAISSSQSPNIPPIQMICLPINKLDSSNISPIQMICLSTNKLDNNETREIIKSKKGYKSLVNIR